MFARVTGEPKIALAMTLRYLAGGAAVDVHWHRELRDVPEDAPPLLLAHEFLDALPVHQLRRMAHGWRARSCCST